MLSERQKELMLQELDTKIKVSEESLREADTELKQEREKNPIEQEKLDNAVYRRRSIIIKLSEWYKQQMHIESL